jgi:hypothetical protein
MKELLGELKAYQGGAIEDRDLEFYDFLMRIERRLERTHAVAVVVASIYEKGGFSEEKWQALFEALFDAGLLDGELRKNDK